MSVEAILGLSLGYNYVSSSKKEAEVKQGKNEYQASAYQIQGITSLSTLAKPMLTQIPSAPVRIGVMVGNTMLPLVSIFLCPTSAAIRQGHYEDGVRCFDALAESNFPKFKGLFPQHLNENRVKAFSFLSENMSVITKIGVAVVTVTLPFFGFGSLAAGIAGPVIFQALETANLVPTKVSLAVEKYMPTVANASILVGGGLFSQVLAAVTLLGATPKTSMFIQKKVENLILKKWLKEGPTLEEIDAPWEERNDLTFEQFKYIFENDDPDKYEINPSHCSKQAYFGLNIPEDRNFKSFLNLFEQIDWTERYHLLKRAFKDDDRFVDLLKQKFPGNSNENLRENFEQYVEKLASEEGQSKEEFLAAQLRMQMQQLVAVLCKEELPKGLIHDLEDAIVNSGQILAYLLMKNEDNPTDKIEMEDTLIKLAIEGGDYCARGVKRATGEISSGIISRFMKIEDEPLKAYELKIRQQLQFMRQQIMQSFYQKVIEIMVKMSKGEALSSFSFNKQTTDKHAVAISEDVHTMDFYRQYLALGFYPLTENERSRFGFSDFANWTMYGSSRQNMYIQYQEVLDQAIKENGEIYFCNYIRQKIESLPNISSEQKEELIEILIDCDEGEKTLKKFYRLFFVLQGVLNVKTIYADWVNLDVEDDPPLSEEEIANELTDWVQLSRI